MDPNSTCYTIVNDDTLFDSGAAPSIPDLRNALQKGSDEVKLDTLRKVIVGTLNGQNYVCQISVLETKGQLLRILTTGRATSCKQTDCPLDAYHPIRPPFQKQADQEATAFLLGVSRLVIAHRIGKLLTASFLTGFVLSWMSKASLSRR